MFTLLPSLYFLGVQYFQRWNASYSSPPPQPPTLVEEILIEKPPVRKVKTRRKKHFRQRKTSLSALSREHILYLMKETGFNEEDIISWYIEFLVRIHWNHPRLIRCFSPSVIVPMGDYQRVNSSKSINSIIKRAK